MASAHNPSRGENIYADDVTVASKWGTYDDGTHSPPASNTWFRTAITTALTSSWTIANDTRAPTFTVGGAGSIPYIRYQTTTQVANTEECPAGFFIACTDYLGPAAAGTTWDYTAYNSEDPSGSRTSYFCQYPTQPDSGGCESVIRAAIHESGHVVGLERGDYTSAPGHYQPSTAAATTTAMVLNLQEATATGWNYHQLGTCDLIELQREYDISPFSSTYANCVDHIPSPGTRYDAATDTTRIRTVATLVDPPNTGCVNANMTLSGTGLIANESATLGRIANNPLSARIMAVQRRVVGGSTWSAVGTASISSSGSWSRQITSTTTGTWEYRAWYGGEVALQNDESTHYTIQWVTTPSICG